MRVVLGGAQGAGEEGRCHRVAALQWCGCGGDQAPLREVTALTLLCSHPAPFSVSRRLAGVG